MAAITLAAPMNSRASLRAGCVGSEDIGMPGYAGWTDAGMLFQTDPASPPKHMLVLGPDQAESEFIDGVGLTPPTEVLPFWLFVVAEDGAYQLDVDGYECSVEGIASEVPARENAVWAQFRVSVESLEARFWLARSAPVGRW